MSDFTKISGLIGHKPPFANTRWLFIARQVGLLLLLYSLSMSASFAQKTWNGATNTDWNTGTNWNPAGVPSATDNVTIVAGGNQPTIGSATTAVANSLEIQAGASLSIASAGSLSVVGSKVFEISYTVSLLNKGTVTNSGTLVVSNTASTARFGIVNEATFINNTGSELSVDKTNLISVWNRLVTVPTTTTAVFTNRGKLSIGQTAGTSNFGAGIYNDVDFQNTGGTIRIDRMSGSCLQNQANSSFANSGTVTIGKSETVTATGFYNFGAFKNLPTGIIEVDRASAGIFNTIQFISGQASPPSSFTNEGKISIGQSFSINGPGIYNLSNNGAVVTFINKAGAEIIIDGNGTSGIHNSNQNSTATTSSFTNEGKISIGQSTSLSGPSIYNQGYPNTIVTFTNSANAEITIDRIRIAGIHNDSQCPFTNGGTIKIGTTFGSVYESSPGINSKSTFTNQATGLIQIERVNFSGLQLEQGTFTNSGTLTIGLSASVSGSHPTIYNSATLVNESGAVILLDNSTRVGLQVNYNGFLTNRGLIDIGKSVRGGVQGLYSNGTVDNQATGVINIDHIRGIPTNNTTVGLFSQTGSFTNVGRITIGSSASAGCTGLYTYGPFTNSGEISIEHTFPNGSDGQHGLRNEGNAFTNTGKITIGASSSIGEWGLWNQSNFNNNSGGEITINRSSKTGLRNQNGTFSNAGKLNIGNVNGIGQWGIWNEATFTNSSELTVDNATETALRHQSSSFTNTGSLKLGNTASSGSWGLWNQAAFTNTSGSISVDRATQIGMVNASSTFTNAASLSIGALASTTAIGLYNASPATFSNSACATLTLFDNLSNVGAFTNAGFFTVNTADPHSNTGLTNDGVIDYLQESLIPNVTNNDLIIAPISTSCGLTVSPALQIGGSNSFSVSTTWYQDPGLTTPVGSYSTNTFTPTSLIANGVYPLYFQVTDLVNNCVKTATISTTNGAKPTLTLGSIANICPGSTSFKVPYTATGSPTLYSLSGPGIASVTDAALPGSPITVNLTSGASGSAISFTLTVKATSGCISDIIIGSATVGTAVTGQPAQVVSITNVGVLGPGNCAVSLSANAIGNNFVLTNSSGYVFSYVFRQFGAYSMKIPAITKPGTYTFNAYYSNCGYTSQATQTVVVTGTACP